MSAYICDNKHIGYLVSAAFQLGRRPQVGGFRWYYEDWHKLGGPENQVEVANMLLLENIKSVSFRYGGESSATLPGPNERRLVTHFDIPLVPSRPLDLAQVFKACDCYVYQSCEHDGWEKSEAFAFIQALRNRAWHALPGYEDANWGAPEK